MTGERRRGRGWPGWVWPTVVAGWAVVLLVAAYVSVRTSPATVREQRTVGAAQSTVDQAVGELVRASGGVSAGVVPEVFGYDVRAGCRLTAIWDGQELTRVVLFTTAPGTEDALLERLATGLPGQYGARVRDRSLRADAGEFVAVRGGAIGPGQVRATVTTGCRPSAALPAVPADVPGEADRAVDAALAALGVTAARRRTNAVACPGGGLARTVAADSAPSTVPEPLAVLLRGSGTPVVDLPLLYAYRVGTTGVVVRAQDGALTVAAATSC